MRVFKIKSNFGLNLLFEKGVKNTMNCFEDSEAWHFCL